MLNALSAFCIVLGLLFSSPAAGDPGQKQIDSFPAANLPFKPGEKLTYDISWSNLIHAGTAVLEVRGKKEADGEFVYHLISTAHSGRFLSKFYAV